MAENFTGVLTQCRLESRAPFRVSRYAVGEQAEFYLACCLETPDGSRVFFESPAVTRTVASCPGAAIVVYSFNSSDAVNWIEEIKGESSIVTPGKPNTNYLQPKVREGDTITIRATVRERKVSKIGKPYTTVNRVSLVIGV